MKYQLKRYTGVLRSLVLSLGLFLCTSNDSLMHSNASVLALPMIEKSFCVELHEEQFKWFNTTVLLLLFRLPYYRKLTLKEISANFENSR